jgi:hypothetical protein
MATRVLCMPFFRMRTSIGCTSSLYTGCSIPIGILPSTISSVTRTRAVGRTPTHLAQGRARSRNAIESGWSLRLMGARMRTEPRSWITKRLPAT